MTMFINHLMSKWPTDEAVPCTGLRVVLQQWRHLVLNRFINTNLCSQVCIYFRSSNQTRESNFAFGELDLGAHALAELD